MTPDLFIVRSIYASADADNRYVVNMGPAAIELRIDGNPFSNRLTIPEANRLIAQLSKAVVEAQR